MNKMSLQSPERGKSHSDFFHRPFTKIPLQNTHNLSLVEHQHPQSFSKSIDKANPFQALTEFKSTEQHYEILKKRLQVLKLKDNKNNNRYHLNQRRLILHDTIQKVTSMEKQKIQDWKQQNQQRKQQQKVQNLKQKLIHHRNIQSIIQTLKSNKTKEYLIRKQQSTNNQQKIIKMQHESLIENKAKVDKIKEIESFSKASLEAYNRVKITGYKDKKHKETDSLILRKLKKQEEIKRMIELQMEMIQKQSSSRLILDKSTQKIKQVLNPQLNLKSSRIKQKINPSKRSPSQIFKENCTNNNSLEKQQSSPLQGSQGKLSINLTRESSFVSQGTRKQFILPQINSSRKYP